MADVSSASPKVYTLEDLQQHKSRDDLWLLVNGKVYDVTKFIDEHPGGDEVLLEEGGRDASEAFEDVGHSDEARAMLPKMLVGDFKGETKVKKSVGAAGSTASGQQEAGNFKFLIPFAILGAWLAWRFFFA